MSTILKLPRGLISTLGLRADGRTPQQLADVIAGTFQTNDLFLLDTRETIITNTNAAPAVGANQYGGGGTGVPLVPPGELWYVWHYFCSATAGAGAAIDLAPSANIDGLGTQVPLGGYVAVAATQNGRPKADDGFWAGPGTELGFVVRSVTLAPTVNGGVVFTRLKI
jgi:hypothetical protein